MAERHRPPGRPPVQRGEPSVSVHVRVSASQFDALDRRAQSERVNIPELIRRRLADDGDDDADE
jgi:hypothetical protein